MEKTAQPLSCDTTATTKRYIRMVCNVHRRTRWNLTKSLKHWDKTEIEAVMNDRPLTHVSSSIDDLEPLTPSHLLYGRNITPMSYHYHYTADDITGIQSDQTTLTNRARTVTNIISQFWKRWRSEYLTGLREYHRATGSNEGRIRVGDVVQIHDEGPRIRWNLAVVEELITGRDGSVRAAKKKTKHGLSTSPIVKLYPIETVKSDSQ